MAGNAAELLQREIAGVRATVEDFKDISRRATDALANAQREDRAKFEKRFEELEERLHSIGKQNANLKAQIRGQA
jgi:hypothetical protein